MVKGRSSTVPAFSDEQLMARDLVNKVRKLRWIGLDKEAEELQQILGRGDAEDVVLSCPAETD